MESLFSGVKKPLPWPGEFPPFAPLLKEIPPGLDLAPQFGATVNQVEVAVHKLKVIAILNTGSPAKFILSWLPHKIKMAPDLNHSVVYGTTGLSSKKSIGAYLALLLPFGKLVLIALAVVLKNKN